MNEPPHAAFSDGGGALVGSIRGHSFSFGKRWLSDTHNSAYPLQKRVGFLFNLYPFFLRKQKS